MKPEPLLGWRQSGEEAEIDIGIMVRDVDVRVMEEGVLAVPDIGAAADQVQRHGHQSVDPWMARIGLMSTVVLDIEADSRGSEAEENGEGSGLPPRLGSEHQQEYDVTQTATRIPVFR
jgi:hypothetical protein